MGSWYVEEIARLLSLFGSPEVPYSCRWDLGPHSRHLHSNYSGALF